VRQLTLKTQQQVLTPLRRASAKVLSDEETEVVFMNIAGLLTHHLRFLDLIKERVSSWSPRSTIGDVFLFNVRPCIPHILDTTPHTHTLTAHSPHSHAPLCRPTLSKSTEAT
jgi:hypothetical protein